MISTLEKTDRLYVRVRLQLASLFARASETYCSCQLSVKIGQARVGLQHMPIMAAPLLQGRRGSQLNDGTIVCQV